MERVGDAEAAGGVGDPRVDQSRFDLEQGRRVLEVVGAGEAVVQRGSGGHDATAAAYLGAFGVDLGVEVQRADRASVRVQRSGHQPYDRGLAGAVGAEEHGDGAAGHLEGQVVDGDDVTERATDT